MKKLVFLLVVFIAMIIGQSFKLQALTITSSPPASTSPDLIVTSLVGSSLNSSINTSLPDYLEIYNQSDEPINLADWSFSFSVQDNLNCSSSISINDIVFPGQWLLPKKYLTMVRAGGSGNPNSFNVDTSVFTNCTASPWLSSLSINKASSIEQTLEIPLTDPASSDAYFTPDQALQHHQRNNSPNSTRTLSGDITKDYELNPILDTSTSPPTEITLYSDSLYSPPSSTAGLKIVELLPHANNCSPLDTSFTCNDYIKLFNSSSNDIDLSSYRLRTSYGGNNSTSSNTIGLNGVLEAGRYSLVNTRNDGTNLSLTESGGYVWLEDIYGATAYSPVVSYLDASAANKTGWSWAYNGSTWQWSSSPQPAGPNLFPEVSIATLSLSSSGLAACDTGQYRNPATNRCKSLSTTASSSSSSAPCPVGQERNPATNRCRKSPAAVLGASSLNVADVTSPTIANGTQWALAGGAVILALGYAIFEWRQEILLGINDSRARLVTFLRNIRN